MKNKTNFLPLPCNQIICQRPKELYVIDITYLHKELTNNKIDSLYLLSVIEHFTKFEKNYIIFNKNENTVLSKIKEFIKNYGVPEKSLTDNGKEFTNNKFKKFCKKLMCIYYMVVHVILKRKEF
jgi:hypothetical protein